MSEVKHLDIKGVRINTDDNIVKNLKTIEDVRKLYIFSHLSEEDRKQAEEELFNAVVPKEQENENLGNSPDEQSED